MPRAYPLLLFHATATPVRYTLSLHDALPISVTALALRLAPLVFVRPGELRAAEWSEFDLANAEWRIDRKSTRLNSSHGYISYAVFCLKKKRKTNTSRFRGEKRVAVASPQRPL